ncbi:MAG TPA: cytochrome c oxidase assembly protein [Gammaproteobacteria bacterium]|jgi:putative membrane protein|nr:cytochrome c oxidase assembly protein [Gammaproteobacteria bacterium]
MYPIAVWLTPWEFSPTVFTVCVLACGSYIAGMRARRRAGLPAGFWRSSLYFLGVILIYVVLQTHFDYFAQHMFWIHRLQHLVLHHLAPFLIMLAVPHAVIASGIPLSVRRNWLYPLWRNRVTRGIYRLIQQPLLAASVFIGLIFLWLMPTLHFKAMLDASLYDVMNWSMALDGLLFWWLILDPRSKQAGARTGFGTRLLLLWAIMIPQLMLGAYIGLSRTDLYTVYAICGRIWPVSPITDQHIGGLITWIPSCMMSVVAGLVVFSRWIRDNRGDQAPRAAAISEPLTST